MLRQLRLAIPELFTASLLFACWLFSATHLQVIAIICTGLLLVRRLEDIRQNAIHRRLINQLKESEVQLVRLANLDRLTGLLNRHALLSTLQEWLDGQVEATQVSLCFLDFDRFKIVNDSLGHDVGDQLLVQIGTRLTSFVNSYPTNSGTSTRTLAARLGGDEFVLIVTGNSDFDVLRFADSIKLHLDEPYRIGDNSIRSTASMGVVVNSTGQYCDANAMLRDADVAMYESKRIGRGSYLVFDTPMRDRIQRRQRLEIDMQQAIENSELKLVYQPIVCVKTGELRSVESLMRWHHPREGLISPGEFIPIAEECGQIQRLCDWAVFEGCCQLIKWSADLSPYTSYSFGLNLSPRQFGDATLAHRIQQTIDDSGVDPQRIVFELTESVLMSEPETALAILQTIKSHGSRIALDDFGIGFSSLASLHRFPVDILKFDRSFIKNVDSDKNLASMVHAISVLAKNLGITTVAEGVETVEQFIAVRELGCDFAQGYLIAKPLSATDFQEFAKNGTPNLPICQGAELFSNRWENSLFLMQR